MEKLKPPTEFNFEGNLNHGWKVWSKHFDFYMCATESDQKSDKIKTSILLSTIGQKGREIYETFTFADEEDKLKLEPVLQKFLEYCTPRKNVTMARYKFFTFRQLEGQTFSDFITELKRRSIDCEFGDLATTLIRDLIVCGVRDNSLRERLLRDSELTLTKAISAGQAAEETKVHSKEITEGLEATSSKHMDKIDKEKMKMKNDGHRGRDAGQKSSSKNTHKQKERHQISNCKFCGGSHTRGDCPAYGKKCRKCKKENHFAAVCLSSKDIREIEINSSDSSSTDEDFIIGAIEAKTKPEEEPAQ